MIQFEINTLGAELQSLKYDGKEYLWQGDPQFWGRRAPILFPIVGRLADDTLRIDGHEYKMKQHGFARDTEFVQTQMNATFDSFNGLRLVPTNGPLFLQMLHDDRENYPFYYDLSVRYVQYGNTLEINWEVKNRDEKMMYFQIGAHPAFLLPDYDSKQFVHGYFRCYNEAGQTLLPITVSHLENGLRVSHSLKEVENKNGLIPITNSTFTDDAILLEGGNVKSVGLLNVKGEEILRVSCPQAQVFGLWAPNKPGCPFVCIEPWCGVADRIGFNDDISSRDCIHKLKPGDIFTFDYSISIK